MDSSLCALYLAFLAALVLEVQAVERVLEVQTVSSNVESLLGCRELFVCEGVGNAVEWEQKVPGRRYHNVSYNMVTTEVDSTGTKVRSSLVFPPDVSISRPMQYRCTFTGGPVISSLEAALTVDKTIVSIEPIADIDISEKSVGETLSFACNVFTCRESVEVAILKGSQLLTKRNFPSCEDVWVPVRVTITEDTADTYLCLAILPDGRVFNESFSVTGTPRRTAPISNPFPEINPGNPQPIQESTTRPSATRRGSATITSPHIHVIVSLLMLFLAAVLTL